MRRVPLALVLVTLAACARNPTVTVGAVAVSDPLPQVSGRTLDGAEITPDDYRGKIMLVNLWATWCYACTREMPTIQRLYERFGPQGVYFLGVDERDNHAAATDFVDRLGVTYPSIEDPSASWADDFGWFALPDTYLVDRSGVIRYAITGYRINEEQVARLLEKMLKAPG